MCSKDNLQLTMYSLTFIIAVLALYLLVAGGILVSNLQIYQAYGNVVLGLGSVTIVMGLVVIVVALAGAYGTRHHNKFFLMFFTCMAQGLTVVLAILGTATSSVPDLSYDANFQLKCLRRVPTVDNCRAYLTDDARAGLSLVWLEFHTYVSTNNGYRQNLEALQDEGACCGFGPPGRCEWINESWPDHLPSFDFMGDRRQECSDRVVGWYPTTEDCNWVIDETATQAEYGGCMYDRAFGICQTQDPSEYTQGCAYQLEQFMAAKIIPLGQGTVAAGVILSISSIFSCTFCMKRKDHDVLPRYEPPKTVSVVGVDITAPPDGAGAEKTPGDPGAEPGDPGGTSAEGGGAEGGGGEETKEEG